MGPKRPRCSPLSPSPEHVVRGCSSFFCKLHILPCRIDCCHKNSSQIIATVQQYLAWVRTLLSVCWIECDILRLDKEAHSERAFVCSLTGPEMAEKKGTRWNFTQLVGCRWFLFFFLFSPSRFELWCAVLTLSKLWCRWQDAKGFAGSLLGLAQEKALLMLFVITVRRNQANMQLWKYVVSYTKGTFGISLLVSADESKYEVLCQELERCFRPLNVLLHLPKVNLGLNTVFPTFQAFCGFHLLERSCN